jgi:hypothetical protein
MLYGYIALAIYAGLLVYGIYKEMQYPIDKPKEGLGWKFEGMER